ncbi:MAG: ABC transporter permease [Gemmatimonadales bacterium]
MSWFTALRTRVRLILGREEAESRMDEEFRFHIDMETEKNLRAGMSREEARRRAALVFGGRQEYREQMRDERGLSWVSGLSLDLKLGLRMLAKAPGLAIIGGLGIALATAIAAGSFAILNAYFWSDLPLDEGDRVVTVLNWDLRLRDIDKRSGYQFSVWRREVKSVADLGAFRSVGRNLISPTGESEPVVVAEMTASGFRVARIGALMGRPLRDGDELKGAAPVIVIGYDVWQNRYQGDPRILGRSLTLGNSLYTVVGVMPPGFAFPISHSYWIPLRLDPALTQPGQGPELDVFGRLVPGATREQALAELAVIGQRLAASAPAGSARIEPRIVPYTDIVSEAEGDGWQIALMQVTISLLLVLICLNVAVLVYARTISRTGEIAVRTALGASRRRIVTQLFLEAFVLTICSASVGLGLVSIAIGYFDRIIALVSETGRAPFWINPGISFGTVAYTLALATLGAVLVGVLPALRATGRNLHQVITVGAAGGKARLGSTWTFLIVAQVAAAIAILPPALIKGWELIHAAAHKPDFPAERFLWARFAPEALARKGDGTPIQARDPALEAAQSNLLARLGEESEVLGVTLADAVPGNEARRRIEVEDLGAGAVTHVRATEVDERYLRLFDVELVRGRPFAPSDRALSHADRPVIVNKSFESDLLSGTSAIGRRVRFHVSEDSVTPWRTVVGVVEDFPAHVSRVGSTKSAVYLLAAPGELRSGLLIVRFPERVPATFVPVLRQVAASVDPTLQFFRASLLSTTYRGLSRTMELLAAAVALVISSVLLLSAGGIHAMMSFTINQRRREIGIRSALGASSRRILSGVLARAAGQLALGIAAGLVLALGLDRLTGGAAMGPNRWILLPAVALTMIAVGLAAAAGPARRGLRVQPTEALTSD